MNEPMTDGTDTFDRDVAALLRDLAIVRKAQSGLKKEIDLVNGEEKALKEELLGLMQAQSMTGCNGAGLKVHTRTTTRKDVVDLEALEKALYADEVLEEYVSTQVVFDTKGAIEYGIQAGWDCVSATSTTSLVISEVAS